MKAFTDYILKFGNLNSHQIDYILGKSKMLQLDKGNYFSEAGKIPKQVGFLIEGIVRCCYYNNKGVEITHHFIDEQNFVSDQQKFEAQIVSSEYIQALTDCKLLVFSKRDWDEIGNTIVGWDTITTLILKNCLIKTIESRSPPGVGRCNYALSDVH